MQADTEIAYADHDKAQRALAFLREHHVPILETGVKPAKPSGTQFFFRLRTEDVDRAVSMLREHGLFSG